LGANYANTTNGAFNPAAQASGSDDANAYGSLFQWGRGADGHELINWTSGFTGTAVNGRTAGPISTPWTSTNFITNSTAPSDWRTPQDVNLWQGVSGTNNPCPIGFRLPTETELNNQRLSWSTNNSTGANASPLKLPMAGYRKESDGLLDIVGDQGFYWSSSVSSTDSRGLNFYFSAANIWTGPRAYGIAVRCLKD
jgi:uncharacterized protein (TIGR02145 family)